MESIESSDLEEGEILEHDLNSLKDPLNNEKNDFQVEGCVNVHLKGKLNLYDQKNYYRAAENGSNNMLDSISSSDEEFNRNSFKYHDRHFNFYIKRRSRLRVAQDRLLVNGSAEDIMCQIDQTICRKNHSYKHKKHKDIRYSWEKLYEKKNCSSRHRSQEMISSHKISGKKKLLKSKAFSDGSESDEYFKNSIYRKNKSHHKKRKDKDSDDYYGSRCNTKKTYINGTEKPVNKIFRDFDEVRRALLEKLKQETKMKKIPEIVDQTSNLDVQEGNISMDSYNSETEPNKEFNEVLPMGNNAKNSNKKTSENVCLGMDNEEDLDLVQLRLIALASNRKQKNVVNLNKSFQDTKKTPSNPSLFEVQTENNVRETKEDEEEEEDADLNRYELLLRAEALKTALLKKHQKRLIKLKTPKLNQLENNNGSYAVSSNAEITSVEPNVDQESKTEEVENNVSLDFNLKLENNSLTDSLDKENEMEIMEDPIIPLKECETDKNGDEPSQSSGSSKKKNQKIKNRKRKKKPSLSEDTKPKLNNSQSLEEDCLTLRSQLLHDLIKKKTQKDSEKSVLLHSAQISANNTQTNTNSEESVQPFKKFIVSPKISKSVPKVPKPEIQRIIVHLGSEESSEDEEISKVAPENSFIRSTGSNRDVNADGVKNTIPEELKASYERSVELLLSEARKKIEIEMGKPENNEVATPEAVYKHLPPSQRLEYIRLKQKIAERERLRKLRKDDGGNTSNKKESQNESKTVMDIKNTSEKSTLEDDNTGILQPQNTNIKSSLADTNLSKSAATSTITEPNTVALAGYFNASNLKISNKRIIGSPNKFLRTNKVIVKERNSLLGLKNNSTNSDSSNVKDVVKKNASLRNSSRTPFTNQSNSIRTSHTQILLSKLKLLLKKIKIEKTIEESYEKEISKLKNQLSLFEKKKSEQRFKIKKLAEESVKTYKIIQNTTVSKMTCTVEVKENKLSSGSDSKKVEETSLVKNDSENKVEKNDKNEISKVLTENEKTEENSEKTIKDLGQKLAGVSSSGTNELAQYSSPLGVFSKASDNLKRVDPNLEMCQFDLTGICRDEECTYQHLRPS